MAAFRCLVCARDHDTTSCSCLATWSCFSTSNFTMTFLLYECSISKELFSPWANGRNFTMCSPVYTLLKTRKQKPAIFTPQLAFKDVIPPRPFYISRRAAYFKQAENIYEEKMALRDVWIRSEKEKPGNESTGRWMGSRRGC